MRKSRVALLYVIFTCISLALKCSQENLQLNRIQRWTLVPHQFRIKIDVIQNLNNYVHYSLLPRKPLIIRKGIGYGSQLTSLNRNIHKLKTGGQTGDSPLNWWQILGLGNYAGEGITTNSRGFKKTTYAGKAHVTKEQTPNQS